MQQKLEEAFNDCFNELSDEEMQELETKIISYLDNLIKDKTNK